MQNPQCLLCLVFPFFLNLSGQVPFPFSAFFSWRFLAPKRPLAWYEKCYFLFVIVLYLVSLPFFHIFPFSFPISYFYLQKRMLAWEREILSSVRSSFRCKAVIRSHWQIQEKDPGFDLLLCAIVMFSGVSSSSLHKSTVFRGFIFFFS